MSYRKTNFIGITFSMGTLPLTSPVLTGSPIPRFTSAILELPRASSIHMVAVAARGLGMEAGRQPAKLADMASPGRRMEIQTEVLRQGLIGWQRLTRGMFGKGTPFFSRAPHLRYVVFNRMFVECIQWNSVTCADRNVYPEASIPMQCLTHSSHRTMWSLKACPRK